MVKRLISSFLATTLVLSSCKKTEAETNSALITEGSKERLYFWTFTDDEVETRHSDALGDHLYQQPASSNWWEFSDKSFHYKMADQYKKYHRVYERKLIDEDGEILKDSKGSVVTEKWARDSRFDVRDTMPNSNDRERQVGNRNPAQCFYWRQTPEYGTPILRWNPEEGIRLQSDTGLGVLCGNESGQGMGLEPVNRYRVARRLFMDEFNNVISQNEKTRIAINSIGGMTGVGCAVLYGKSKNFMVRAPKLSVSDVVFLTMCGSTIATMLGIVGNVTNTVTKQQIPSETKVRNPDDNSVVFNNELVNKELNEIPPGILKTAKSVVDEISNPSVWKNLRRGESIAQGTSFVECPNSNELSICKAYRRAVRTGKEPETVNSQYVESWMKKVQQ